jgi:hypothetical protein
MKEYLSEIKNAFQSAAPIFFALTIGVYAGLSANQTVADPLCFQNPLTFAGFLLGLLLIFLAGMLIFAVIYLLIVAIGALVGKLRGKPDEKPVKGE